MPGSGGSDASNRLRLGECAPVPRPEGRLPHPAGLAQDADDPAAFGKLVRQRLRQMIDRAAQKNHVVGRLLGMAVGERAGDHDRVVGAHRAQRALRFLGERFVDIKRDHGAGETGHDRRRVARAAADIENHVIGRHIRLLDQPRQHHGLHQIAAGGDLHVLVHIGHAPLGVRNEALARDLLHRVDEPLVCDAVRPDLARDHVATGGGVVGHLMKYSLEAGFAAPY